MAVPLKRNETPEKRQERMNDAAAAVAEYQAAAKATDEKTARLRALRLARAAQEYEQTEHHA